MSEERKWSIAEWQLALANVMICLANGREPDAMQIIYEVLTNDMAATVAAMHAPKERVLNDVNSLITYYSDPRLEEYEKCAKLLELKGMLEQSMAAQT